MSSNKRPADFSERTFAMTPKMKGPGYVVAEILGAVEDKEDEIRVRRWDTAAKDFSGPTRIKRTQVIGDVLPGDSRLAAIKAWVDGKIVEHEYAETKKQAEREKMKNDKAKAAS